jgi:hypothetical protein
VIKLLGTNDRPNIGPQNMRDIISGNGLIIFLFDASFPERLID